VSTPSFKKVGQTLKGKLGGGAWRREKGMWTSLLRLPKEEVTSDLGEQKTGKGVFKIKSVNRNCERGNWGGREKNSKGAVG